MCTGLLRLLAGDGRPLGRACGVGHRHRRDREAAHGRPAVGDRARHHRSRGGAPHCCGAGPRRRGDVHFCSSEPHGDAHPRSAVRRDPRGGEPRGYIVAGSVRSADLGLVFGRSSRCSTAASSGCSCSRSSRAAADRAALYRRLCPPSWPPPGRSRSARSLGRGTSHLAQGAGLLPVLVATAAGAVSGLLRLGPRGPRLHVAAAGVLGRGRGRLPVRFQPADELAANTLGLLLAPASVLASSTLAAPGRATRAAALLVVAIALGSVVAAAESRVERAPRGPARSIDRPVQLGPVTVRTDARTAEQVAQLRTKAAGAGWRPGTPLVDANSPRLFRSGLGARVPPALLPALPRVRHRLGLRAVRGLGPGWRDAWI